MNKFLSSFLVVVFTFAVSGCGTIIHGTSQNVSLQSDPPGATATLSTGLEVTTPEIVKLSRSKDYIVTFEKEGYKKKQAQISRDFNAKATILGNILWLLVGCAVDFIAGGAWTLDPEAVHITLEKA